MPLAEHPGFAAVQAEPLITSGTSSTTTGVAEEVSGPARSIGAEPASPEVRLPATLRSNEMNARGRSDEKGFTLVELLVVVAILGILAAVVVFAVRGVADNGQKSGCSADTNAIRRAEEAHFARTETYADEKGLFDTGTVSEPLRLHDVAPDNVRHTYTITPAPDRGDPHRGSCGAVGAAVGTCGPAPGTPCSDPDNR